MRQCIVIVHVGDIKDFSGRALVCFDGDERDGITVCRRILYHFSEVMERCAAEWLDGHFP